jgi:hypothetical protein
MDIARGSNVIKNVRMYESMHIYMYVCAYLPFHACWHVGTNKCIKSDGKQWSDRLD